MSGLSGLRAEGIHIRQTTSAYVITVMLHFLGESQVVIIYMVGIVSFDCEF